VGFALAVTHPFAGNIGGGGFMLIRLADGRTTFIDFRERAPGRSTRDMYLDARASRRGTASTAGEPSGVPGSVRGFELALSKYGRKKWAEVMAPAIELASKGFPVSYSLAESLRTRRTCRGPESKRIYQKDGAYYESTRRSSSRSWRRRSNGLRRTARGNFTKARRRRSSPRRWRRTAG
jgi:gamma-glutamyltranspeptidase / glutathione hydrolase